MDNDPPGSWNGVVQTPLRKLWVQVQRVATSMRQVQDLLVGYPRAPFASVVMVPRPRPTPNPGCLIAGCPGTWSGPVPGACARSARRVGWEPSQEGVWRTPSGTPQKGGSGTPKKGGSRDTKQCKFWRVSSVLIQGMFCFWGFRGVSGGVSGGVVFGGVRGVSLRVRPAPETPHARWPCPLDLVGIARDSSWDGILRGNPCQDGGG
jgi:hypothetical protein